MANRLAAIHIGKKHLGMDDESYRLLLNDMFQKNSAKDLTQQEQGQLLDRFKQLGFVPKRPKESSKKISPRSIVAHKIRAIWITMHKQGLIQNGSDQALDAYCQRMTKTKNGQGVQYLIWLDNKQAQSVLESLKRWHYRLMNQSLDVDMPRSTSYEVLSEFYANLTKKTKD